MGRGRASPHECNSRNARHANQRSAFPSLTLNGAAGIGVSGCARAARPAYAGACAAPLYAPCMCAHKARVARCACAIASGMPLPRHRADATRSRKETRYALRPDSRRRGILSSDSEVSPAHTPCKARARLRRPCISLGKQCTSWRKSVVQREDACQK